MTNILLNINEDDIRKNDRFSVLSINDCGDIELYKTISSLSPCPGAGNFYVYGLSGTIPAGCYDGTEYYIGGDINLVEDKIKLGTTIFGVTGTYTGPSLITGTNVTAPNNATSTTIPLGLHDGTKSVTFVSTSLLAGNIRRGINLFGTIGTDTGIPNPQYMKTNGYHTGITHAARDFTATYDVTPYSTGVIVGGGSIYLCYSSYAIAVGQRIVYTTVVKFTGSTMTTIINDVVSGSGYLGSSFNVSPVANKFRVFLITGAGPFSYRDVDLTTGAITTGSTATVLAALPTSTTFSGKTYIPKLPQTIRQYEINPAYTRKGRALNVNITS